MATYYRWRKSTIRYRLAKQRVTSGLFTASDGIVYFADTDDPDTDPEFNTSTGKFSLTYDNVIENGGTYRPNTAKLVCGGERNPTEVYGNEFMQLDRSGSTIKVTSLSSGHTLNRYYSQATAGTSQGYVYSTSSSAYPNGGVSGSYYYDQRTTVTSPTAPSSIGFQAPSISTPTTTVQWGAATSNTDYPVNLYEVSVSGNGSSYSVVGTTSSTSMLVQVPTGTTMMYVRVRARDTNNQWGTYATSQAPVYLSPVLTVPQMVMQGQSATISWSAIEGADSYTLQRKANTDADWTQVYSGANLSYSETVGTWTSVQYRVQAVFSGTPGGWAESAAILVVSSSALVISGQDGDLGTVVNDIPYSISTDTGNQITATITVNSAVIFSGNVGNSTSDVIPVLDLVNGEGTIVIEASVTASGGPVSAVRTWTYTKAPITFPNAGSVAQLTKEGENIFPKTLAECVRLPGGKTLDEVTAFPCQVYIGSYVGTGTSGQNNPTTLTFPFEPKIVFIARETTRSAGGSLGTITPMIRGVQRSIVGINGSSINIAYLTWDNNSLSFYGNGGADTSLNESGITYHYVAIG